MLLHEESKNDLDSGEEVDEVKNEIVKEAAANEKLIEPNAIKKVKPSAPPSPLQSSALKKHKKTSYSSESSGASSSDDSDDHSSRKRKKKNLK